MIALSLGVVFLGFFMLGASFGSFFGLVAARIKSMGHVQHLFGKSKFSLIVTKRSICFSCGIEIKPFHLIPVVGYIVLKGRCANCGHSIGKSSLFAEILMGISCAALPAIYLIANPIIQFVFAVTATISLLLSLNLILLKSE